MSHIIVSLTVIPDRVSYLDKFLRMIDQQQVIPDILALCVPENYKKRSFGKIDRTQISKQFSIIDCTDYGPATKIIPTLAKYSNPDQTIIYCDDDRYYHKSWIARLLAKSEKYPHAAICDESNATALARLFLSSGNSKDLKYRLKRAATLGGWNPLKKHVESNGIIAEGFGGVLVKSGFFPTFVDRVPDEVFFVDDVWLSACLAHNNIDILSAKPKKAEKSNELMLKTAAPLNKLIVNGMGREQLDTQAIRYVCKTLDIWPGLKNTVYL